MKPRLEPALLTEEDQFSRQRSGPHMLRRMAEIVRMTRGDRRDADLMFEAQRIRELTFPVLQPPMWLCHEYHEDDIAVGGCLPERKPLLGSDITSCA